MDDDNVHAITQPQADVPEKKSAISSFVAEYGSPLIFMTVSQEVLSSSASSDMIEDQVAATMMGNQPTSGSGDPTDKAAGGQEMHRQMAHVSCWQTDTFAHLSAPHHRLLLSSLRHCLPHSSLYQA